MKIVQLPGSLSRDGGGVFQVALNHALQLQASSQYDIEVIGKADKNLESDLEKWNGIPTTALQLSIPLIHQIAGLQKTIVKSKPDLLHSHMLWTSQSRTLIKVSNALHIPYVVSPHGMLDSWTIDLKKRIALATFERKSLSSAACIHALNLNEYQTIRELGFKNPIAIIPNGVTIPLTKSEFSKEQKSKKTLLFLSRIDPKKGLDVLINSIYEIKEVFTKKYKLVIHGWGDEVYISKIKKLIRDKELQEDVLLKGPVFEKEKEKAFQQADAFILPSHSEGFPMVVLEAWSHAKPVLMTESCNIPEGFIQNAAIKIDTNPNKLKEQLLNFINMGENQLTQIGQNGQLLVQEEFTWTKIGQKLCELYDWILDSGKKPDFVMLN